MSTSRSKPNPKRRGFTLMEVMVVVCIMASLAALVATNVFGVKADADQKTTRLAIHTAEGALDLFRLQKGHYPSTTEGFDAVLAAGLLKEVPQDAWNRPLIYRFENGQPILGSLGADGLVGGAGPDADLNNQPVTGQSLVAQAF